MTETIDPGIAGPALAAVRDAAMPGGPSLHDVTRFQDLMDGPSSKGFDYYVESQPIRGYATELDSAVRRFTDVGSRMQEALNRRPSALPEHAPIELHALNAVNADMREFMVLQLQFQFAAKVVENTEKAAQTLYKLQG